MRKKMNLRMLPPGLFLSSIIILSGLSSGIAAAATCDVDFTRNGTVDMEDFTIFRKDWGRSDCRETNPCRSDLNGDGRVDMADFILFRPSMGQTDCPVDSDGDGFTTAAGDCNDSAADIFPGALEVCGDNIDQDCSGGDSACGSGPHAALIFQEYPGNCLGCHNSEATEMMGSTHYKWLGEAPDMVNGVGVQQGKLTNAVNSYCINIKGDWPLCGKCHVGRGLQPDDPQAGLDNIDCLACHNEEYARARTRLADGSMGVAAPTDEMVRNVHLPTRANCLMCHAKAGGGDAVKRGDLSVATITNSDPTFDVHMNTGASDLACQSCHVFQNHRVIGKGSDLRATDDPARGSEISCTTCHEGKDAAGGHATAEVNDHVAKVACQTCHIPTYAKVATETHRDWRNHAGGTPADGVSGPGHPHTEKAAHLIPQYRFWNRLSDNYLLGDDASRTYNPEKDTYPTSTPLGDMADPASKIYPFKYKTAVQPKTIGDDRLIALDTLEYLGVSGNVGTAIEKGLVNMGYPAGEPYEWVTTDTYQLLNHGVEPAPYALQCADCHDGTSGLSTTTRMPFAELGYHAFRNSATDLCALCHSAKSADRAIIHDQHARGLGYSCTDCHGEGAPLIKPQSDLCNDCHGSKSASARTIHERHVKGKGYDCSKCHTF